MKSSYLYDNYQVGCFGKLFLFSGRKSFLEKRFVEWNKVANFAPLIDDKLKNGF